MLSESSVIPSPYVLTTQSLGRRCGGLGNGSLGLYGIGASIGLCDMLWEATMAAACNNIERIPESFMVARPPVGFLEVRAKQLPTIKTAQRYLLYDHTKPDNKERDLR